MMTEPAKHLFYTAFHINVPKKGWRHKCCRKKTFRNRNVFLTTTIKAEKLHYKNIYPNTGG